MWILQLLWIISTFPSIYLIILTIQPILLSNSYYLVRSQLTWPCRKSLTRLLSMLITLNRLNGEISVQLWKTFLLQYQSWLLYSSLLSWSILRSKIDEKIVAGKLIYERFRIIPLILMILEIITTFVIKAKYTRPPLLQWRSCFYYTIHWFTYLYLFFYFSHTFTIYCSLAHLQSHINSITYSGKD